MGLESATYINQLVITNPVGGVDDYATADDHLRLIKAVLKGQFPNFTALAMNASVVELNRLVGITSGVQSQLDGKSATGHGHTLADISDSGALAPLNSVNTGEITNAAVSLAKMANMATDSFIGRDTAASGVPEILSAAIARAILNVENAAAADQTAGEIEAIVNHDNLQAIPANDHIDHSAVSLSGGNGIQSAGLGNLTASRTINAENAAEGTKGVAELATQAETNTGTDDTRMVTPSKLKAATSIPDIQRKEKDSSNTTANNDIIRSPDPDLQGLAFVANVLYTLEAFIIVATPTSTTPGFRWEWTNDGPGGTIRNEVMTVSIEESAGWASATARGDGSGASPSSTFGTTNKYFLHMIGQFRRNVAGDLAFSWAQNVSHADPTTVYAGSWVELRRAGV